MQFEVKAQVQIEDGRHTGIIKRLTERTDPYHYVDIFIKVDDKDFEIKYGVPANISIQSKFGKLLQLFGKTLVPGEKIDPEPILLNKKCSFMTITRPGKDGFEYSDVVEDSIKPIQVEQSSKPNPTSVLKSMGNTGKPI